MDKLFDLHNINRIDRMNINEKLQLLIAEEKARDIIKRIPNIACVFISDNRTKRVIRDIKNYIIKQ